MYHDENHWAPRAATLDDSAFMRSLDKRYRQISGLAERRHYSIFYSQIVPSPLLIVGYNPGGNPETWTESNLASRSFYENFEHEYVDCHYELAVSMRNFLMRTMDLKDESKIRSIPKTNLIFRRSVNQDSLAIRASDAIQESLPVVEEIIVRVAPQVILFEGTLTLDKFEASYCTSVAQFVDGARITTPNGRSAATIYRSDRAFVRCLNRELTLIGLGHPSKYSRRVEWADVIASARKAISRACAAA